jgi:outer membrane receptor protein involved in Fe transport
VLALLASCIPLTQIAWAAPMDEIVITSTKRGEQVLQEVPIAVQAVTSDEIRRNVALDLLDLQPRISSLIVQDLGPGDRKYIIRGINSTATSAVGVYYDEAPITARTKQDGGGRQADFELHDIDRIEVLKGPQGTLYGAQSAAGTIRYIPNRPDSEAFDFGVGSQLSTTEDGGENYNINGMVNLPIIDGAMAFRGVGWYTDEDGFIDNQLTGNDDINDNETWGLKAGIEWDVVEDFTLSAFAMYQDREVGGTSRQMPELQDTLAANQQTFIAELAAQGFSPSPCSPSRSCSDRTTQSYTVTPWDEEASLYNVKFEWEVLSGSLLATGTYFKREIEFNFDSTPILLGFGVPITAITVQPQEREVTSGEIRWASSFDGPVQMVVGGFYSDEDKDFETQVIQSGPDGKPLGPWNPGDANAIFGRTKEDDLEQWALFGEVEWFITDAFSVLGGLRYYDFEIDSVNRETQALGGPPSVVPVPFKEDGDEVSPKLNATYRFNDDFLVYGTYSEGFRPGGTNDIAFVAEGDPIPPEGFGSDELKNYEFGWKTEWLDNRLTFNGAIYYIEWEDLQTATFFPNSPFNVVQNAGEAEITGIEFDVSATPIDNLFLSLVGSIQNAEFTDDVPGASSDPDGLFARDGDDIPNVPDYQLGAVAEYTWPGLFANADASVRVDWSYQDDRIISPNNPATDIDLDSYHLVGLRAGLDTENWTAALYVKNLLDEDEAAYDGINTTQDPRAIITARPRTIGVQLQYRMGGGQ